MKSKHLVDSELAQALKATPAITPTRDSLPGLRENIAQLRAAAPPAPGVTVEEKFLTRADGTALRILLYTPASSRLTGALLWFHGGGMVMGTPEMNDPQSRHLAHRMGCMVIAVDYRLAPEFPYPGGLDDCYLALKWAHESATSMGIPRERIAVTGESGGGCLAAALVIQARDRAEVKVSAQFLQYAMLDDRTGTSAELDPMPFAGEFVWTKESNSFAWHCVLGHAAGQPQIADYAAPGRVEKLSGLPSTCIIIGELDLFIGENLRFAKNLMQHGVSTELHVYPGAYHGFMSFVPDAQVTKRAERDFWGAMERHFLS